MQEIPKDTDLSYLERKRLEDEFRKFKELKHKAEQYAIEAKQTSQRLSAENSKLKEDLSCERHHNEVTRNNIIREFEEKVSFVAMADERKAIEMEVSDQEVKEKAHRLLRVTPRGQVDIKRGEQDINMVLLQAMVKSKLFAMPSLFRNGYFS